MSATTTASGRARATARANGAKSRALWSYRSDATSRPSRGPDVGCERTVVIVASRRDDGHPPRAERLRKLRVRDRLEVVGPGDPDVVSQARGIELLVLGQPLPRVRRAQHRERPIDRLVRDRDLQVRAGRGERPDDADHAEVP